MVHTFEELVSTFGPTDALTTTIRRACDYAEAQSHRRVSMEHLLLALPDDPDASIVLQACHIDLPRLETDVSAYLGRLEDRAPPDQTVRPAPHDDLIRIFRVAHAAAQQRGRSPNGGLVLAAIVGDGRSPAANMLRVQGLTFEQAVKALQQANAQLRSQVETQQPALPAPEPPRTNEAMATGPSPEARRSVTDERALDPPKALPQGSPQQPREPQHPAPQTQAAPDDRGQIGPPASAADPATTLTPAPTRRPPPQELDEQRPAVEPGPTLASDQKTQDQRPASGMQEILQDARRRVVAAGRPNARPTGSDADALARLRRPQAERPTQPSHGQTPPSGQTHQSSQTRPTGQTETQPPAPARAQNQRPSDPGQLRPPAVPAPKTQWPDPPHPQRSAQPQRPQQRPASHPEQRAQPEPTPRRPHPAETGPPAQMRPDAQATANRRHRDATTAQPVGQPPATPPSAQPPHPPPAPTSGQPVGQPAGQMPAPRPDDPRPGPQGQPRPPGGPGGGPGVAPLPSGPRGDQRPSRPAPGSPPPALPHQQREPAPHGRAPFAHGQPGPPPQQQPGSTQPPHSVPPERPPQHTPPPTPRQPSDTSGRLETTGRPARLPQEGQLAKSFPRKMRAGVAETVEVRVPRHEIEALNSGSVRPGGRRDLIVSRAMTLRLRAPDGGFTVETAAPETQWVENRVGLLTDDYVIWRWTVSPCAKGRRTLVLHATLRTVTADGIATETAVPDERIEVRVVSDRNTTLSRCATWLLIAGVGGVIGHFAGEIWGFVATVFPPS